MEPFPNSGSSIGISRILAMTCWLSCWLSLPFRASTAILERHAPPSLAGPGHGLSSLDRAAAAGGRAWLGRALARGALLDALSCVRHVDHALDVNAFIGRHVGLRGTPPCTD